MSFVALGGAGCAPVAPVGRKSHDGLLGQVALLCSASALVLALSGQAGAGQLPASAFQTYDFSTASGIVAGPTALYTVRVNDILPTQLNLGLVEVGKKVTGYDLLKPSALSGDLITSVEPVVIGPGGKLYLTNGHHTFSALQRSVYGASNPVVYINVIANYSNLTEAQFWAQMQASNYLLPLDNGAVLPIDPATGAPIPSSFSAMTNDPYRGLEYGILKNKNSKLFPDASNIAGASGATIPGLVKTAAYYSDFIWANAYRYANNGLGLPYLSPGDIHLATQWNLNGTNVTRLQKDGAAVTVAQLPGYILPSSLVIGSVIDTATVRSGVLDGNGTFTGLRGLELETVTIGTPGSNTGFILQLGADRGGTVTLSGTNTYTGGTTILAGTLIIGSDANLGAASPAGLTPASIRTAEDVRAANGIVFNSLSEGKGTLQINSTMTLNRPIGVGGETAIINPNGNTLTLTGPIVSLDINANGFSDLSVAKSGGGIVILPSTVSNPYFYGDWVVSGGTLQASSDAALGNTTGNPATIGQIVLDGGTFQAGASFNSVRSLSLSGGSTFDTNGFATSFAGALTDVQRRLTVINSGTGAGAVTFGSLNISGSNVTNTTGATSTLRLQGSAGAPVTVTLTNGVTRTDRSTLLLVPMSAASLGVTDMVRSGAAPTLTNGIVAPWTFIDRNDGSNDRFDFATYDAATGYRIATYTKSGSGGSGGIRVATATDIVQQTGNATLNADASAFALKINAGATITATGYRLTLGDGVNAAGLILGGSGSTGIVGGELRFGGSEAVVIVRGTSTISSNIVGTNGLTLAGTGTLTLSNTSSGLTGPVNIDSGTLNITAANALTNVSSVYLSNVSSNPSAAFLTMSAGNTFASLNSGGSNSTITLTGAGTVLTIGQTNNANSALNNLDSTISSAIVDTAVTAGSSAIVKNGAGMLDLSGATMTLTTGSNITVNGGVLRVGASSFVNTNNVVTASGSEVQFAQNAGGVFAGNITGAGVLHLIGGTLKLTGIGHTYTGGTVVEQGSTLHLTTANVSTGNANITNAGGLIVFDQATSGTYGGVISDGCQMQQACTARLAGSLVKDDSTGGNGGTLTLGAVQTYTGGTFVEAGTLTLGVADAVAASAGVDLGRVGGGATATLALGTNNTIQGLMSEQANTTAVRLNANTLTLNTATGRAWDFGGAIDGAGNLVKAGGGAQILSGSSSYTGTTTVNAGLLQVDGSIASSALTTVNAGGALGGIGTVGNAAINGGTLSPGRSIGTLSIQGSLSFTAASSYLVELNPTTSDRTNVTGTATLGGATVSAIYASGSYVSRQYTILNATGGVRQTFNALVNTNLPANFTPSLSYDPNNVYLNLTLDYKPEPSAPAFGAGLTRNQQNVANALVNSFNTAGGIPLVYGVLSPVGLTQAAGEIATGTQQATFNAMSQFMGTMFDPFAAGRGGFGEGGMLSYADEDQANAYAAVRNPRARDVQDAYAAIARKAPLRAVDPFTNRWNLWATGYGGTQTTDGSATAGSASTAARVYGVAAGADYRLSPETLIGFSLGGAGTNYGLANGLGKGSSEVFQAGVYARHTVGAAYLAGALAYGWQDVTTDRTVLGIDRLRARFDANALSGRLEGGYRFVMPWMGVTPYAAGQFTSVFLPNYAEQAVAGANTFALAYASKDVTASRSELGVRTDKSFALNDALLTLRGRAAWAHNFDTSRSISATFLALPAAGFTVNGAAPARDAALVSAGAEMRWRNGVSLAGTFEGEFSRNVESYAGKGTVRYQW